MALSGSTYKNIGSGWRLLLEWSATQNITENYSTVTAKLYWQSLSSAYAVYSSTSRNARIVINSDTSNYTVTAALNGGQKKLLGTKTFRVNHNDDGTGRVAIGGQLDLSGINLGGTDYGTQYFQNAWDLNTIPRASSLTSSRDWTLPRAFPQTINRASSRFTHKIDLWIKRYDETTYTYIKSWADVDTSIAGGFTEAEFKKAYEVLAQGGSGHVRLVLTTYDGTATVGVKYYDATSGELARGTLSTEKPSVIDVETSANWNIGEVKNVGIARNYFSFTHKVAFYINNTLIFMSPVIDYAYTWTPTTAQLSQIYTLTKNSPTADFKMVLTTLYSGVQVGSPREVVGTAYVINSAPTFSGNFTYKDSNAATVAITGNDQQIIQSKSILQVLLPAAAKAQGKNGASIVRYEITANGITKTQAEQTGDLTFTFGEVNAGSNLTLTVKAVDSRGFSASASKTVIMLPYKTPSLAANVRRLNNFEKETTLNVSGAISSVSGKNTISAVQGVQYRYKENTSAVAYPSTWKNIPLIITDTNYAATAPITEVLDQTKSFVFEVRATDKLGNTIVTKTIPVGRPSIAVDDKKNSLGVGDFPSENNSIEVGGATFPLFVWKDTQGNKMFAVLVGNKISIRFGTNAAQNEVASFGVDESYAYKMRASIINGDTIEGKLLKAESEGKVMQLIGQTHVYQEFYPQGISAGRFGYIGYGSPDSSSMWVNNSQGRLLLQAKDDIYVQQTPWTRVTLNNPWKHFADSNSNWAYVEYRKTSHNTVRFRGMAAGGSATTNTVMFTLPSDLRPPRSLIFGAKTKGAAGQATSARININHTGTVEFIGATESTQNTDWVSLSEIEFDLF
ncbi:DUF859 domain-containing protein [Priestia endophytica]|uniref:DUF859 domain-containing protein n=1 Tax=Priestia endophytica TaxID=135735 RepID=UPI00203B7676|nr:DUF859 domain-containing protein [Priestia endophytica]MCM3536604.1 DUF859 domain-containing protein [Priestia endophytica]